MTDKLNLIQQKIDDFNKNTKFNSILDAAEKYSVILKEIESIIKPPTKDKTNNKSKKSFEDILIKMFSCLFDKIEDLDYLPIFYWGRHYKYDGPEHLFGVSYKDSVGGLDYFCTLKGFAEEETVLWEVMEEICHENLDLKKQYDVKDLNRTNIVKFYGRDEHSGTILCVVRDKEDNSIKIELVESDSNV